jgi:GNAT superfamily N-acetyltransferase
VFTIRSAVPSDAPALVVLLESFMEDAFRKPWHGSAAALLRDGFGAAACFHNMIALASPGDAVGFAAWQDSYDLHHCVRGGLLLDMYVRPTHRGRGVALGLVTSVAARVRDGGGCYLRGQSVPNPAVQRMYERMAVTFPGAECNVGGRAFRALADLAMVPAREAVRRLPLKAWNYEA